MSAGREQDWQQQIAKALEDCRVLIPAEQAAAVLPVLEAAVAAARDEERKAGQELLAEQQRWASKLHDRAQKETTRLQSRITELERALEDAHAELRDLSGRIGDWRAVQDGPNAGQAGGGS